MRVLLTTLTTLCLICFNIPASADDEATTYELDIEAQALPGALKSFAEQTDLQVVYFAAVAEGKNAPALEGEFTADAALDRLLANADLEYRNVDARTYSIAPEIAADERGASDSKNLSPTPILSAQNQTTQAQTVTSSRSSEGGTSIVTGKVTDARTGANLKGAKVTIRELGLSERTNDYGEFRIVSLPSGKHTLTISYLGTVSASSTIEVESGTEVRLNVELSDSIEEIVVLGQRSARAQSLNLQRTAPNNTEVVSADLLGNFIGTTVSEALRRVPGVSFQQSMVTGEGTNVMIRGLEPDLNTVTLNGVRLPDSSGRGRSGDLSNILADSISKITVHKSLLPSHDSSGTGGLVEIKTKPPLERARRYLNFSLEGGQSGNDFNDDMLVSTTASGAFGSNEQFGLSASLQFRERDIASISQEHEFQYGQYLPADADPTVFVADPTSMIDPRLPFPFEDGGDTVYPWSQRVSSFETATSNITGSIAAEWQIDSGTNLRLDVSRIDAEEENLNRNGGDFYYSLYMPTSVQALDGEFRQALNYFNAVGTFRAFLGTQYEEQTDIASLRGESETGRWKFKYGTGYTKGSRDYSSQGIRSGGFIFHDPAFVLPSAVDPVEGRVISMFAPVTNEIQQPLLTPEGYSFLNDPAQHPLQRSQATTVDSSNERITADFSGRCTLGHESVKYIEAGIYYERADFESIANAGITSFDQYVGSGATAADIGLGISNNVWARIGAPVGVGILQVDNAEEVFARMRVLDGAGVTVRTIDVDPRLSGEQTREEEFSSYIQTQLNFGKLEIIGGVRVANVKTTATKLRRPTLVLADGSRDLAFEAANTNIVSFDDTVTDVLPRVLANYRYSDDVVIRGGYYFTVARPTIDSLSRAPRIHLSLFPNGGSQSNQPTLTVSQGNPGLKPAFTHNFDVGAEFYSDNIGIIKVGLFYKRIENFIDSTVNSTSAALEGIELPDDPRFQDLPSDIFITVLRPINATSDAEIWGAELAVEHRFANLPGLLDGLGIYGNYTYSDSSRDATQRWLDSPIFDEFGTVVGREPLDYVREAPFDQQVGHSGTAAITYERDRLDATLSYTYQDRRLLKFGDTNRVRDRFGFDTYADSADSLDLRAEYRLTPDRGGVYRLWFEASDMLDESSDPTFTASVGGANGVQELTKRRVYIGGRAFKLGVSATF